MLNGPATCENRSMDLFLVGGGGDKDKCEENQKAEGGEMLNKPTFSQRLPPWRRHMSGGSALSLGDARWMTGKQSQLPLNPPHPPRDGQRLHGDAEEYRK